MPQTFGEFKLSHTASIGGALTEAGLQPWYQVFAPLHELMRRERSWFDRGLLAIEFVLRLGISTLFGLAICRSAGFLFGREESVSFRHSSKFALGRWAQGIGSIALPIGGACLTGIGIGFACLPANLPWIGQVYLFVVSPVVFAMGLAMAGLLLAAFVCWPFMIAAIAVDDCDGFGGFSRSYSFWTGRFAYAGWLFLVACALALVVRWGVWELGWFAIRCSLRASRTLLGGAFDNSVLSSYQVSILKFVSAAVSFSYFWCSTTIIYLLLRKEVDRRPIDQIAMANEQLPPRDPLPVVGIPATDADKPSAG
ncbi:MAG: hypothetical protein FJ267_00690 [Planctomycetes bacterium]|nr:hypothetical protein [Planctomycetota bacterium]